MASPPTDTPNPFHSKLLIVGTSLLLIAMAYAGACSPFQRAIVRQVIDTTEKVCGDAESTEECLQRLHVAMAPTAMPSGDPAGMPPRLMGTSMPAVVAP